MIRTMEAELVCIIKKLCSRPAGQRLWTCVDWRRRTNGQEFELTEEIQILGRIKTSTSFKFELFMLLVYLKSYW